MTVSCDRENILDFIHHVRLPTAQARRPFLVVKS